MLRSLFSTTRSAVASSSSLSSYAAPLASTSRATLHTSPRLLSREQRGQVGKPRDGDDGYSPELLSSAADSGLSPPSGAADASESSNASAGAATTRSAAPAVMPGLGGRFSNYAHTQTQPYRLYCSTERRNTILTLTDSKGNPLHRVSSGMVGYRKSQRKGAEPALRAAYEMFEAIRVNDRKFYNKTKQAFTHCELIFKGIGAGRDGVHKALLTAEGAQVRRAITKISDVTRIKVGGVRPKKRMGELFACVREAVRVHSGRADMACVALRCVFSSSPLSGERYWMSSCRDDSVAIVSFN